MSLFLSFPCSYKSWQNLTGPGLPISSMNEMIILRFARFLTLLLWLWLTMLSWLEEYSLPLTFFVLRFLATVTASSLSGNQRSSTFQFSAVLRTLHKALRSLQARHWHTTPLINTSSVWVTMLDSRTLLYSPHNCKCCGW